MMVKQAKWSLPGRASVLLAYCQRGSIYPEPYYSLTAATVTPMPAHIHVHLPTEGLACD